MSLPYSIRLPQNPKSPADTVPWAEKLGIVINHMYQMLVGELNNFEPAGGSSELPVGIVIFTADGTNPADLGLPGTWEEY